MPPVPLGVGTLQAGDPVWGVNAPDLLIDVAVEHHRQEQRASTLSKAADAIVLVCSVFVVLQNVCEDVAVRLRC